MLAEQCPKLRRLTFTRPHSWDTAATGDVNDDDVGGGGDGAGAQDDNSDYDARSEPSWSTTDARTNATDDDDDDDAAGRLGRAAVLQLERACSQLFIEYKEGY